MRAAGQTRPSPADLATIAVAMAFFLFALAGGFATGVSWDEAAHRGYGLAVLEWYRSPSRAGAESMRLYWYGALFDLCALGMEQAFPALGWIRAHHLATALFATVGLVYAARLGRALAGPRTGLATALVLAAMPRWTGDAMFNPVDVPFAAMMAVGLFHLVRLVQALPWSPASGGPPLSAWVKLGLGSGLALGVRPGGLLLPGYATAAVAAWAAWSVTRERRIAVLVDHGPRLAGGLALALILTWLLAGAVWPYLLVSPVRHAIALAAGASRFEWQGTVFFSGARHLAQHLPRAYLPVWLAITTPLPVLGGLIALLVAGRQTTAHRTRDQRLARAVVLLAVAFPLAYALATHAVVYDGIRHFLFVLPPLAALCGAGWTHLMRRAEGAARGRLVAAAFALCLLEPLSWYARSFPHAYAYFSPLAGGLERASTSYETDYWGLTMREAAEWLDVHRVQIAGDDTLVVLTNTSWHLLAPWFRDPSRYRRSPDPAQPYHVHLQSYRAQPPGWERTGDAVAEKRIVPGQRLPVWRIVLGPAARTSTAGAP
jgi:hypothetical protein